MVLRSEEIVCAVNNGEDLMEVPCRHAISPVGSFSLGNSPPSYPLQSTCWGSGVRTTGMRQLHDNDVKFIVFLWLGCGCRNCFL
jgi:hypothetical protein